MQAFFIETIKILVVYTPRPLIKQEIYGCRAKSVHYHAIFLQDPVVKINLID